QIVATLEQAANTRLDALGHLLYEPIAARIAQSGQHSFVVAFAVWATHLHILANRELVRGVILKEHADAIAQIFRRDVPEIYATDANIAVVGVVEAQQQL